MKRAVIIGVAGHVDHGKTWLTRALTGVDTDRLPEEKERGLSMVPGFAPLTLPGPDPARPLELGLIDVPGHERFIRQMLTGASGLDLALLVVAADEGPRPQTLEHLQLLRLLGVQRGLAVLTKTDAVDESQLQDSAQATRVLLAEQNLTHWPLLMVSARTGEGLMALQAALYDLAARTPERPTDGPARLPLDRAFTRPGWGPVVTGTLWGGCVQKGRQLELWQAGGDRPLTVRVRGLQVFGRDADAVTAGQRLALNLAGPGAKLARPGDWLAAPQRLRPVSRLDLALTLLPEAAAEIRLPWQKEVTLFHGAANYTARLRLPVQDPARSVLWGQIETSRPLTALVGDRVIIRSSDRTLGGGEVLAVGQPRLKLNRPESALLLSQERSTGPLQAELERSEQPLSLHSLLLNAAWPGSEEAARRLLAQAADCLRLSTESETYYWSRSRLRAAQEQLQQLTAAHFQQQPLSKGFSPAGWELFSRLERPLAAALLPLLSEGLVRDGEYLRPKDQVIPADWKLQADLLLEIYQDAGFLPPTLEAAGSAAGLSADKLPTLAAYLQDQGLLLEGPHLLFARTALTAAGQLLRSCFGDRPFSLARARDRLGVGRKAAQELLETLDRHGYTRREELTRVLLK